MQKSAAVEAVADELPHEWEYSYIPQRKGKTTHGVLTFSPLAAMKLRYWLHLGNTEIGGFGVTRPEDPLYILDIHTIRQECTGATVEFDDVALAKYLEERLEHTGRTGLPPIWIHTHPGNSPNPSYTDEQTLDKHFSKMPFAVMFIMAKNHATYARLRMTAEEGGVRLDKEIPVEEAWAELTELEGVSLDELYNQWLDDYHRQVKAKTYSYTYSGNSWSNAGYNSGGYSSSNYNKSLATSGSNNASSASVITDTSDDCPYYGAYGKITYCTPDSDPTPRNGTYTNGKRNETSSATSVNDPYMDDEDPNDPDNYLVWDAAKRDYVRVKDLDADYDYGYDTPARYTGADEESETGASNSFIDAPNEPGGLLPVGSVTGGFLA